MREKYFISSVFVFIIFFQSFVSRAEPISEFLSGEGDFLISDGVVYSVPKETSKIEKFGSDGQLTRVKFDNNSQLYLESDEEKSFLILKKKQH